MTIRVGINGFGRIGRQAFKAMVENYKDDIEVVAINDIFPAESFLLLLKYDSIYGHFKGTIEAAQDGLIINGKKIRFYMAKTPAEIPWAENKVDVVVEASGVFTDADKAAGHIQAGAKKVVISAPAK
ncbi:MAG: glyceraldehyde 3-phosphate dehydrogenase NAD-binding domain-containing protein, partial [Anaerolineae bacterium]